MVSDDNDIEIPEGSRGKYVLVSFDLLDGSTNVSFLMSQITYTIR